MSRSWRQPPPEGRLFRKPQHEPTLEEELQNMNEERYLVFTTWSPKGEDLELEEFVSLNRTKHGAWCVLQGVAEGFGYDLKDNESSFDIDGDEHVDRYGGYIMTVEEGP